MCDQVEDTTDDASNWMEYYRLLRYQRTVKGREIYVPSPTDIPVRGLQVRWLEDCGFPRSFVVNVMEHDNPTIDRVKQMVKRYGVGGTYRRCVQFMVETEYDRS